MRGWTARKNALVKFETNNQHPIKRDDKKLILSLSVIMVGPCFAVCPLFSVFSYGKVSKKACPWRLYSRQTDTRLKTRQNVPSPTIKVKKFSLAGYERGNFSPIFLLHP